MILEQKPLNLAEVKKYIKDSEDNKEILGFLKKFAKLNEKDSGKLKEEIEGLKLIKLNESHIIKIVDFLPEDKEDLGKVLIDVSLDENEINSIVEIVKKYA